MSSKIIDIRAKAFAHEGVRMNRVMVEADGSVLVWDCVAGHYTRCHSMSESATRRARKLASA